MEKSSSNQGNVLSDAGSTTTLFHSITHPAGCIFRAAGLALLCFIGFGSYFCYDNPGALHVHITQDLQLSEFQFNMLYSVYSWPNVVLGLFGGFLIDRVFGVRLGTSIYMGLSLLGQLFFSTGAWIGSIWIMLLGRFIFGIGSESLSIAQNNYTIMWFKGSILNMVFGLQLTVSRFGSGVNDVVMEGLYQRVQTKFQGLDGLGITLYIATLTCVFSFVCSILLGVMDRKAERLIRLENSLPSETVKLSDIKNFGGKFWLLNMIIVFYYGSLFPFVSIAQTFFMKTFHTSASEANHLCALVYLISGIGSPFLGLLIDRLGRNISWVILGILLTIVAQCLFTFLTTLSPYIGIVCLGISSSILASSVWPLVSLIVPDYQLGTAFGVCSATQNSALSIYPIVVGVLTDNYGYISSQVFFISSLAIALIAAVALLIQSLRHGDVLNMSPSARLQYQEEKVSP